MRSRPASLAAPVKFIVAGAASFVGSRLVDQLLADRHFICVGEAGRGSPGGELRHVVADPAKTQRESERVPRIQLVARLGDAVAWLSQRRAAPADS